MLPSLPREPIEIAKRQAVGSGGQQRRVSVREILRQRPDAVHEVILIAIPIPVVPCIGVINKNGVCIHVRDELGHVWEDVVSDVCAQVRVFVPVVLHDHTIPSGKPAQGGIVDERLRLDIRSLSGIERIKTRVAPIAIVDQEDLAVKVCTKPCR